MRLFSTCVLAVLAVMTCALALPQDKTFESGLQSSLIRRSPAEQNKAGQGVEPNCYLDSCPVDKSHRFAQVWYYDSPQAFSGTQVYPDFTDQFSSLSGWEQVTVAIAAFTNSIDAYAAYLQITQLSIKIIIMSVQSFISSFYVIATRCYKGYSGWGAISSYSNQLGPIYAQLWEAIQGLLMYCDQSFGIDKVIPRQSSYWTKLVTSVNYFAQFGSNTKLVTYFKSYPVNFNTVQFKLGISSLQSLASYSSSRVRQTPWVSLTQSRLSSKGSKFNK